MSDENHEVRELRFKVRALSRSCGHQGQTIHLLRAELAEVRALNSKVARGEIRRLESKNARLTKENAELGETVTTLEEKLSER